MTTDVSPVSVALGFRVDGRAECEDERRNRGTCDEKKMGSLGEGGTLLCSNLLTYQNRGEAKMLLRLSHKGAGVSGGSDQWIGVFGTTKSPQAAGGEFQNTGGGDLLRAGLNGAFRVLNNGDVLVRGQKIGAAGAQGAQGPKGEPGLPGPAVRSVAVCADATGVGNPTCPCTNRTVTRQAGACTVTSETGSCSAQQNGCCAVCAP